MLNKNSKILEFISLFNNFKKNSNYLSYLFLKLNNAKNKWILYFFYS